MQLQGEAQAAGQRPSARPALLGTPAAPACAVGGGDASSCMLRHAAKPRFGQRRLSGNHPRRGRGRISASLDGYSWRRVLLAPHLREPAAVWFGDLLRYQLPTSNGANLSMTSAKCELRAANCGYGSSSFPQLPGFCAHGRGITFVQQGTHSCLREERQGAMLTVDSLLQVLVSDAPAMPQNQVDECSNLLLNHSFAPINNHC